jgi:MFS transporter, BCD family, chlorophyll transporter
MSSGESGAISGALESARPKASQIWRRIGPKFLPFADAASDKLPLGRLLRLSLFQVSVGMCTALLIGTLNRVMIVELGVAAWLVALMVALPLLVAPWRALVGFRSDTHRSVLGWRRVPYIWMGSLLQFGGLAIMPFALILLSGDTHGPVWVGPLGAALAFLMVGAGVQTTQTAGLALATDLAPEHARPRVVALMYVMLLVGMLVAGTVFSALLTDFSQFRLIQVVQGAAEVSFVLNMIALWKQEPRRAGGTVHLHAPETTPFSQIWRSFVQQRGVSRYLVALAMGTAAFSMQDVILEPYGAQILNLSVGATTALTALMAFGAIVAFAVAARCLTRGVGAYLVCAIGVLSGLVAFSLVVFAEPANSPLMFRAGVLLIGFGGGLFSVGSLTAAMGLETRGLTGLALGAWGAVQACAAGLAIAAGGAVRDIVSMFAMQGALGEALRNPATGYSFVYHIELALLFATLIALGPLVRLKRVQVVDPSKKFGLSQFPS